MRWLKKNKNEHFRSIISFDLIASNSDEAMRISEDICKVLQAINLQYCYFSKVSFDEIQLIADDQVKAKAKIRWCGRCNKPLLDGIGNRCGKCGGKIKENENH